MNDRFEVEEDERAVTSPRLLEMVEAARAQPLHDTDVSLPIIRRQIAAKGKGFRNGVTAGVVLAAAAAVTLWVMGPSSTPGEAVSEPEAGVEVANREVVAEVPSTPLFPFVDDASLSDAVRVTWKGGAPPRALGAWELELGDGSYEVALAEPRPERLTIHVGTRTVELAHGELMLASHGTTPVVTLVHGVAAWVDEDGTRTPLEVESVSARRPVDGSAAAAGSATELAREAERLLGAGERRAAIVVLRKLVQRHPNSTAARSALLDLGRELGREGMRDHARCAYEVYLRRWPDGQMRADVRRSLQRLGRGAACDGLDPR